MIPAIQSGFNQAAHHAPNEELSPLQLNVNKADLLEELDRVKKTKNELLSDLKKIQEALKQAELQEAEINQKLENLNKCDPISSQPVIVETPKEVLEISRVARTVLVVNTKQIIKSKDKQGEFEHYSVNLISKDNEQIEVNKWPVDIKKYGNIEQIIISDGENQEPLPEYRSSTQRLITYLSTDFDVFRKEINKDKVDKNGSYSNKDVNFDCQRFSYYLKHGKEGSFPHDFGSKSSRNYRNEHEPMVGHVYSIKAETANFGKNGSYSGKDMTVHYFMCLANDLYVSKYGQDDVYFTSYKQILDAYFPDKFVQGKISIEF